MRVSFDTEIPTTIPSEGRSRGLLGLKAYEFQHCIAMGVIPSARVQLQSCAITISRQNNATSSLPDSCIPSPIVKLSRSAVSCVHR